MKRKYKVKSRQGFTLIEVICALAILTLAVSAFTVLITSAGRTNISTLKLKQSFEKGVEQMALNSTELKTGEDTFSIAIDGKGTVDITVDTYETQAAGGKETVHLEKFVPK